MVKAVTSAKLKYIAAAAMLIDHMGVFIPDTPIWFHYIGRISAPIFLFCVTLSYRHTSSKTKLFLRLYILSTGMSVITMFSSSIAYNFFDVIVHPIENNFVHSLFLVCMSIWGVENFRSKKRIIFGYLFLNVFIIVLAFILNSLISSPSGLLLDIADAIMMPLLILPSEGGLIFVFIGLAFYFTRADKKIMSLAYILCCLLQFALTQAEIIPRIILRLERHGFRVLGNILFEMAGPLLGVSPFYNGDISPIYYNYQWMMVFVMPLILMYNGNKGSDSKILKYGFYIFYPLHLIALFITGNLIYNH